MKKILLTMALGAVFGLAAQAQDTYTVYNDGVVNNELHYYSWWNAAIDYQAANPDGNGKVLQFKAADGSAAASGGWNMEAPQNTGIFHDATLNFSWYAEGTGKYTIRLTSVAEQNQSFTVTADNAGKWNTVSYNVKDLYPTVAEQWNTNKKDGVGYIFSVILENGSSDAVIYFNNVYYSGVDNSWEAPDIEVPAPTSVPTPTQPASDVVSIFSSAYTPATNMSIGWWGQSTSLTEQEIAGQKVLYLRNFNYQGWDLNPVLDVTDYDYMHVDLWTADAMKFGFTPISNVNGTQERSYIVNEVKQNEWNSYDVPLSYFKEGGVNFSSIFQFKLDQGTGEDIYVANVYFWKEGDGGGNGGDDNPPTTAGSIYKGSIADTYTQTMSADDIKDYPYVLNYEVTYNEDKTLTINANFVWENGKPIGAVDFIYITADNNGEKQTEDGTITTTATYEAGTTININVKQPVALGDVIQNISYTVGSSNVATNVPLLTAEAQNVTETSAEIAWNVQLPDALKDGVLTVKLDGMTVESSPILLEDLTSGTTYTKTLTASVELNGETYDAEPIEVTFTTKSEAGSTGSASGTVTGNLLKAYLKDEEASQARDIEVTLDYTIICSKDELTFELVPQTEVFNNIEGMVPQLFIDGAYTGYNFQQIARANVWSVTVPNTYEEGQVLTIGYFCAYAGFATMLDGGTYKVDYSTTVIDIPTAGNELVDVYTLTGVRVAKGVKASEVVNTLNPGLYIIGGKKVIVK